MQTIELVYAIQCRFNRIVNRVLVIKQAEYRNTIREFSKNENRHVKNNAKSCSFHGAM